MVDKTGETIYNCAFRQQRVADHTFPWNTLLSGLQAATILGQGQGQDSTLCTLLYKKSSEVLRMCNYYVLIRVLLQAYVDFFLLYANICPTHTHAYGCVLLCNYLTIVQHKVYIDQFDHTCAKFTQTLPTSLTTLVHTTAASLQSRHGCVDMRNHKHMLIRYVCDMCTIILP